MPATRSGKSSSKEQQPTISSSRPFPIDEDVIVISSDDDFLDLASIQALAVTITEMYFFTTHLPVVFSERPSVEEKIAFQGGQTIFHESHLWQMFTQSNYHAEGKQSGL